MKALYAGIIGGVALLLSYFIIYIKKFTHKMLMATQVTATGGGVFKIFANAMF